MPKQIDRNSMLYWWPLVQGVEVPMPRTIIVRAGHRALLRLLEGEPLPDAVRQKLREAGRSLGYPLFVRTDQASGKHNWEKTCFVPTIDALVDHIARVVEENECADVLGLPYEAIVLRQYIPLDSAFTAFWGRLPIARERRYFVRDGKVECHHPYWPEDAIAQVEKYGAAYGMPENWRELLAVLNREDEEEVALLTRYAQDIGVHLPGYWSVDFAKGKDGAWYFIDAALGEASWHPECEAKKVKARGDIHENPGLLEGAR